MRLFKRRPRGPALQEVREASRAVIREITLTEPDENWIPTAIYYGKDGRGLASFPVMPLPEVFPALSEWLDKEKALACGFWAGTWIVAAEHADEAPGVLPEQHPHGFEALVLQCHSDDGRAMEFARILRRADRPPTLGKWEILGEE